MTRTLANKGEGSYDSFEPLFPPSQDPEITSWRRRLAALQSTDPVIRVAVPSGQDGRRMKDLQIACSPITVQSVKDNVGTIADQHVLLAEIDDTHVGFCVSFPGPGSSDPLYIQVVGVVPQAQRRGVGLALLTASAEHEPRPDIVLATQNENLGARALNARFAESIGASIARVPLSRYRHNDLGIPRGAGYHAWLIQRAPAS